VDLKFSKNLMPILFPLQSASNSCLYLPGILLKIMDESMIEKLSKQIEQETILIVKANKLHDKIKGLEDQVQFLKSSTDYISREELRIMKLKIEMKENQLENVSLFGQQMQLAMNEVKDLGHELAKVRM
jgi:hypothetical protein